MKKKTNINNNNNNNNNPQQATLLDLAGKKLSLKEIQQVIQRNMDTPENTYEIGVADRKAEVAELLLDKCRMGDTRAIIFYLKCHGWVEGKNVDITSSDGSLNASNGIASLIGEIKQRHGDK